MTPSLRSILLVIGLALSASGHGAETELLTLRHNPFSRPDIVNERLSTLSTPETQGEEAVPPEEVELNLSATMVSEKSPMAIVDGELLAIGDEIQGLKLIAVLEGKVIFTRAGKKFSFMIDDREVK